MTHNRFSLRRILFFGHRYIGIICALFILVLATTGMMLNHTESLKLAQRHVSSPLLLGFYGIEGAQVERAHEVDGHWFSQAGGQLYLDDVPVATTPSGETLLGVVEQPGFFVAAYPHALLMISPEGELIERFMPEIGTAPEIGKIGLEGDSAAVVIAAGGVLFVADEELLQWHSGKDMSVQWSQPATPPVELRRRIAKRQTGDGLTLERVILDLHSGRIAGGFGVLLMDAVAVGMLLLVGMGVWMWARR